MNELDITSVEAKTIYREISQYVLKETGLIVSNLYIAQLKQEFCIVKQQNCNNPKSEHFRQAQCLPEKENVIMTALKYLYDISKLERGRMFTLSFSPHLFLSVLDIPIREFSIGIIPSYVV